MATKRWPLQVLPCKMLHIRIFAHCFAPSTKSFICRGEPRRNAATILCRSIYIMFQNMKNPFTSDQMIFSKEFNNEQKPRSTKQNLIDRPKLQSDFLTPGRPTRSPRRSARARDGTSETNPWLETSPCLPKESCTEGLGSVLTMAWTSKWYFSKLQMALYQYTEDPHRLRCTTGTCCWECKQSCV